MSNDYEIAISEGANIVRVGSAIFGSLPDEEHEHTAEPERATGAEPGASPAEADH